MKTLLHEDGIFALTLLPNGLLASGSTDTQIMIWNVTETSPLYNLSGHTAPIRGLTVINKEYLASCSNYNTVKIWSLSNYQEVRSWTAGDGWLTSLAFDSKLNVLVSGGDDNKIRVWYSSLWTTTKPGLFLNFYAYNLCKPLNALITTNLLIKPHRAF